MLFRMPPEDLHIAAKFDPVLSRLSESRCPVYYIFASTAKGPITWYPSKC